MNNTFKISITRTPVAPTKVGPLLNSVLADEYVLYLATRSYCWNATGPDAPRLRQMLGTQIREMDGRLDRLAWQVGAVGDWTRLSPTALAADGRLAVAPVAGLTVPAMVAGLCDLHDELIVRLKAAVGMCTNRIGDSGTADLLGELLVLHERDIWMLRALRWDLPVGHERDRRALPAQPQDHRVAAVA